MGRRPEGNVHQEFGRWRTRVQIAGRFANLELPTCDTQKEAKERARLIAESARSISGIGDAVPAGTARAIIEELARAHVLQLPAVLDLVQRLCDGRLAPVPQSAPPASRPTFAQLAARWTSGELADEYPDHVKHKRSSDDDEQRLKFICAAMVGKGKFGDLPIDSITLDHCEAAMRALPERSRRPATRRHYAQVMARLFKLAAYPLRLIERSPLPPGFLPSVGRPPGFPFLYPEEERALLCCQKLPLERRLAYGVLAREGLRVSELIALQVGDLDLKTGTITLDANKTNEPRTWALGPDVVQALRVWFRVRRARPKDRAFINSEGREFSAHNTARQLRVDLSVAGVTRQALHQSGANTRKVRAHDLRGTFVTLALAAGRTETWVADRTGHRSSIMINRYRRSARTAAETGMTGWLCPMDLAFLPDSYRAAEPTTEPAAFPADESSVFPAVPKVVIEPTRP